MGLTLSNSLALTGRRGGRKPRLWPSMASILAAAESAQYFAMRDGAMLFADTGGLAPAALDAGIALALSKDKQASFEARRNLIVQTAGNTATPGVIGSGGALPTGWVLEAALGLTTEVLANNIDPALGGCRTRVSGTPSGTGIYRLRISNFIIREAAQPAVVMSSFIHGFAGSMANISSAALFPVNLANGAGLIDEFDPFDAGSLTGARRVTLPGTPPSSAGIRQELRLSVTSGQAIDITFDIAAAQIEESNAGASPYQPVGANYPLSWAGNHGPQSSSSFRPTRVAAGASFDGNDDRLPGIAPNSAAGSLFARVNTATGGRIIAGAMAASSGRCAIGLTAGGLAAGALGNDGTAIIQGGPDIRDTGLRIIGLSWDGDTVRLWLDGEAIYEGAQSGSPAALPVNWGGLNGNGTFSSAFSGTISDALCLDYPLTPAQITALNTLWS